METVDPVLTAFLPSDIRAMFLPYASVHLGALVLNLLTGFLMALLIGAHFRKYASAFCNRQDFSRLFPLLMLTVILIITVVKASLALALGLVGALSIVRFRTPIKEPEELVYLFLNIGVAVALGAGQTLAAILACFVTLALVTWVKRRAIKEYEERGIFLTLSYGGSESMQLGELKSMLADHMDRIELRRYDDDDGQIEACFFVTVKEPGQIDNLFQALKDKYQGLNLSLLEQHNIAGV
ncbi:DUF4956 domain-containing protein [Shewanella submarina]|uniref:DUF4956 domain-containing protein n=1 Tax=Shewanella submarina TaxID=2016376 RepID=A0ABV7GBP5_9GAMM|nr:DUF4956 domain-containing protein [Shewanella submarina]MCL1038559.1 DUF4956 domain-containing protein [Shewanella submarina]